MTSPIISLNKVDSTNSYLANLPIEQQQHGLCVSTQYQTKGRGQAQNVWESEQGQNLLFSLMLFPHEVEPDQQFAISEIVSLALVELLEQELGKEVTIKWPNDIYLGNSKLAGILIEHTICGSMLTKSIVGIGLNVNQITFSKALPNSISMAMSTGKHYPLDKLLTSVVESLMQSYHYWTERPLSLLHQAYMQRLYRREGFHSFALPDGTQFQAHIADVHPMGPILLKKTDGSEHYFAFKEVNYVI